MARAPIISLPYYIAGDLHFKSRHRRILGTDTLTECNESACANASAGGGGEPTYSKTSLLEYNARVGALAPRATITRMRF